MIPKLLAGLIAVAIFLLFMLPVVVKLRDLPLTVVVFIGLVMLLVDFWQGIRDHDS